MSLRNLVAAILAITGLALSGYLVWVHYHIEDLVCTNGGCEIVQTSKYSEVMGIPVGVLGLGMFLVTLALVAYRHLRPEDADLPNTALVGILFCSVLYFCYLSYLEANVIHAWCQWCVATSIVTLLLFLWELVHTWRAIDA